MASLPPLLPTPPASLELRDADAVDSRAPKRHRPLEPDASGSLRRESNSPPRSRRPAGRWPPPPPPPPKVGLGSRSPPPSKVRRRSRSPTPSRVRRRSRSPPPSRVRRRSRSLSPSKVRRQYRSPPPSKVRRQSRSPPPSKIRRQDSRSPPPSKIRRRSRSPPYVSVTQRLVGLQRAKRPSDKAAVEGERARSSSLDESLLENRPSHSNCKAPSRNARRKKMKRQTRAEATKEMREAPSRNGCHKKMKRQIWAEAKKEFREMKKDKLLENIKKLQACICLLEKDGADMAEIMEFKSLLESTKKQYVEIEAQLAKEGSSGPLQVINRDRLEKTHVETMAAPVEKVERDEQNMDSGKVEGSDAVSEGNELAEEVNRLKSELETVRRDRDYQLAQAQSLMADVAKQKEVTRRYGVELEDAMRRVAAFEEGCRLRRDTIKALQSQLASANEKLTVPSPTRD